MADSDGTRPKRYFALHYILLRFLGLGWWHHPDEGDTRNFPGWYLYYSIITQLIWVGGFVGLETIDPFIGEKDLDRFMFSLSFVITHDLTIIKLCIFYFRNSDIQEIVRILEIDLYQYYQNDVKNRKTIRVSKLLTVAFLFFGWITIGNANIYGIVQDLRWKDIVKNLNGTSPKPVRTLPQPIFIPWPYQKEGAYIPTFALETMGLLWTGHIVMTIDTFIGSVILHMSTQFAILHEAISTAYDRTMVQLCERFRENNIPDSMNTHNIDEDENNERLVKLYYTEKEIESALESSLINCFRQHQLLIGYFNLFADVYCNITNKNRSSKTGKRRATTFGILKFRFGDYKYKHGRLMFYLVCFKCIYTGIPEFFTYLVLYSCVEKFSRTYSYGFMTQLMSSTAAICVVMVQVSQDVSSLKSVRLVTSLAFFVAMIIQLALQCFTGNELTLQAASISDAVMQCKWESMTPRLRRLLLMTMFRAQRPLRLSAAGFTDMDNGCFLSIMKAAYSYYAVLSQKQNA